MSKDEAGSDQQGALVALQQIHPEVVMWIRSKLTAEEKVEFFDGLRPILHRLIDDVVRADPAEDRMTTFATSLLAYIESWRISLVMAENPEWQQQVEDAENRWNDGDRETVAVSELRSLLGV